MAAPITHMVLADKVFDKRFKDEKKKDFFIGSVFPDVRYVSGIKRRLTHHLDLKEKNSFETGIKFHCLIDEIWNEFVRSNNYITSFKLLGDELLYEKIGNWEEYISYFDKIFPSEFLFNIPEEKIKKWHKILQQYFSKKPNDITRNTFIKSIGVSEERIDRINQNIDLIRNDQGIIKTIEELYDNIEILLNKYD